MKFECTVLTVFPINFLRFKINCVSLKDKPLTFLLSMWQKQHPVKKRSCVINTKQNHLIREKVL